ncbi:MAG TPA: sigma 54-interacting transcriptional regulator, partial [Acetobacteraceae bacterium]|nr:sigma 54-interacting transcriptional regulator [Acetobacteraceae bacterium]
SWMRSGEFGIDPRARAAPLAARADGVAALRERHRTLIEAACGIFADTAELLAGTHSILLLTSPDGIVLEAVGDPQTLSAGEQIHLMRGGDWREAVIGTNGIGTAIATGRPAQVHAAEHFCEGIKSWTCAAAPVLDLTHGTVLGIVDISGPPSTYQRTNLTLAVSIARQIEMRLDEHATRERARLLEACLERLSSADAAGLLAIDRNGRLVHRSGRAPPALRVGACLPGLGQELPVEQWSDHLPDGLRAEWFDPVTVGDRTIGAMVVIPTRRAAVPLRGRATPHSEADPDRSSFSAIIGESPAMHAALDRARLLADKRVTVLIEGETGVGKELFARAMHGDSPAPFIAFNCGAASRELIAGELFGHVRGAYTGATSEGRSGRFELAHGGTLCLDEVGELPLDVQPLLLRALEEGVIYRLGSPQPRRVDVRLLALTNRDLGAEVEAGRFRRDLFYRVAVTRLRIPPLREREGDIDRLVEYFNRQLAARHGVAPRRFGAEVRAHLRRCDWPGNVRELRNMVEGLLLTAARPEVTLEEIQAVLPASQPRSGPAREQGTPLPSGASLDATERAAIINAVLETSGNLALAARMLGISRSTLYRKAARYGISLPSVTRGAEADRGGTEQPIGH